MKQKKASKKKVDLAPSIAELICERCQAPLTQARHHLTKSQAAICAALHKAELYGPNYIKSKQVPTPEEREEQGPIEIPA